MEFRLCPVCRHPLHEHRRRYCSDDCKRKAQYQRNKARRATINQGAPWPPAFVFWDNINKTDDGDHWLWTGCLNRGIPCLRQAPWPQVASRRWAWHVVTGDPVPKILHAACGQQTCVNPEHLAQHSKTHCLRGHDLAQTRQTNGECRACNKLRNHNWYAAWYAADPERARRKFREKAQRHARKQQLVAAADERILFSSIGRWLIFDGHRWTRGSGQEAYYVASALVRERWPELKHQRRVNMTQWLVDALRRLADERAAQQDDEDVA